VAQNTPPRRGDEAAAQRLAEAFSPETIDALVQDAEASGTPVDGMNGLLNQLTKAVLERALQTEMTEHLGYESGSPDGHGTGNSRNGKTRKTVSAISGPVEIEVPRDRNGSFEPAIVPKRSRRLGNIDDMILSLYSRGMTTRESKRTCGKYTA
jgi:putative transposase